MLQPFLEEFLSTITLFADKIYVAPGILLIALLFAYLRQWRRGFIWLFNGFITYAAVWLLKHGIDSPRPPTSARYLVSNSFPSGHVTLSVAIYGLLAYFASQKLVGYKKVLPYALVGLFALTIGFSRVYLGEHWFSDVIGGFIVGLGCLLIAVLLYKRKMVPVVKPRDDG